MQVVMAGENMQQCPICKNHIQYASLGSRDAYKVTCPLCGEYNLTRTALATLRGSHFSERSVANISGWLRENSNFEITSMNIEFLKNLRTPPFHDRADQILIQIEKETYHAGQFITENLSWQSIGRCINKDELFELVSFLAETRRVQMLDEIGSISVKILPEGWSHLEKLKKTNSSLKQGFVAMWFSEDMEQIYNSVMSEAIINAGYAPHRVDQREHNDKIDDEIIAQIRKSRFVLADFTGHRGGVYYEAGFAKGLGLEVFWSCREDDISNLHFDIRQYNCIVWENDNLEEFKSKITNRIEAVIGHGPHRT